MAFTLAEAARLAVAVIVLPFVWRTASVLRMSPTSRPLYSVTVGAIYLSYLFTTAEAYIAGPQLNAAQHLMYGVAGLAAVPLVLDIRRQVIAERDEADG